MSSFYLFTGIAHFTNPEFFLDVMPAFMPSHQLLVDLSGYAEIILALALLDFSLSECPSIESDIAKTRLVYGVRLHDKNSV